ncbi:MAG: hypothetical protein N3G78_04970 [Desulfobacterota bacterium]|nr:hypothetical protein [Thermodesulfobacteriota bacterium]
MKRVFGLLSLMLVFGLSLFTLGIAHIGGIKGVGLIGMWFFYTFGTIIVLAQLIPAGIVLFGFIATGISSYRNREERPVPVV